MRLFWLLGPQGQQQPQPTNIASQPTMTAQFPTPQINKESTLNSLAVRGATNNYRCRRCCTTRKVLYNQQLQMQQMQQPVQKTGGGLSQSAMQMPMFSGLTQQQILNQLQQSSQTQWQQPIPQQHQMQTPSMLAQAPLGVQPQSQSGHQQMTQLFNVPSNQGGSPMPVQQQALLPGRFSITLHLCIEQVCPEISSKMYAGWIKGYKNSPYCCNQYPNHCLKAVIHFSSWQWTFKHSDFSYC